MRLGSMCVLKTESNRLMLPMHALQPCSQWQPACIEPMRSWSSVTFKVNGIEFSDFKTIEFR